MPCRATQDGWLIVERSNKTKSTGEGNGKPLQYSCFENSMNSMKRQNDMTLKDELQWRNNSRKNEETELKRKQCPVVDVTGDGSKVQCCKEQYCIGTWNVRSMNQGTFSSVRFSSVTQSCPTLLPHESQHARPPYPSSTPGVHTDSCP